MGEKSTPFDFTLRDLPLPSRVVLSFFLVSVGVGYFSALVQLHFNGGAKAGEFLPGPDEAASTYGGGSMSQLERLITADETKCFNGNGQMREAFTARSSGWRAAIQKLAEEKKISPEEAEQQLRQQRQIEIDVVVHWLRSGHKQEDYAAHSLPEKLCQRAAGYPVSKFFKEDNNGKVVAAKVSQIINDRCARCHFDGARGAEGEIHLEEFRVVQEYAATPAPDRSGGSMSMQKLAQTTHVHLLGFSMLYGLTGLILSLTSYPLWFRLILGPWPLLAQLIDISFWWLGRADPVYARLIPVTGGLAAMGLLFQIGFTLFDIYGKKGRLVLLALVLGSSIGGFVLHNRVIGPYLENERARATELQEAK